MSTPEGAMRRPGRLAAEQESDGPPDGRYSPARALRDDIG